MPTTYFISQDEYDDFMSEPDTEPFVRLDVVQRELDSAESLVAQLIGHARTLGYNVEPPKNWMERLERELDGAVIEVDGVASVLAERSIRR
jgi:hypothetical protein